MKKIETDIKNKIYWQESEISCLPYNEKEEWNIIRVYEDFQNQTWLGMGGSITESSAYNFHKLSEKAQEKFLDCYYSSAGLNYNLGRISIGSNDFSLSSYEYTNDNLNSFNIVHDEKIIIPTIKKILKRKNITIIASPWSPPKYMKSNNKLTEGGRLLPKFYKDYAQYLKRFINSYKKHNININYLTIQNEPFATQKWESCLYELKEQKDFIYKYLIKELKKTKTKILLWDHNKENLYNFVKKLYRKHKKIAGVAFHWYTGSHHENVLLTHIKYPELLLFHTEGCTSWSKYDEESWILDAELYLINLIGDMKAGLNGYIDWNILLDFQGGPNHKENYCKSPVILNKQEKDFLLTPIYYYLGHISKYILNGAKILTIDCYRPDIYAVAAKYENTITVVLLNITDNMIEVNIVIDKIQIKDTLKPHTIITYQE